MVAYDSVAIAAIESCSCKNIGGAGQVRCSDALKTKKANPLWIHYLSESRVSYPLKGLVGHRTDITSHYLWHLSF
jgi:hypothetical protein